ncbi:MAG: hypothetical protein WC506_06565 [Candidatus Micrarchaeia archaeon]
MATKTIRAPGDAGAGAAVEAAWDSTCRIIFGRSIGPLGKYEAWLSRSMPARARRKSCVSGRSVSLAMDCYAGGSRFVSAEEVEINKPFSLGINQVKDLDSILEGMRGQAAYAGNRHLGSSSGVIDSDIVLDSQNVMNSGNVEESRCVASSFMVRKGSRNIFGSGMLGAGEFLVRVFDSFGQKRSFECSIVGMASDCYFSHNVLNSHDMLFCFGQRNRAYCVGNLQLPRDKYLAIKSKILGEAADALERDGEFPSLLELAGDSEPPGRAGLGLPAQQACTDISQVEKGFSATYSMLFGRKPAGIREYGEWLSQGSVGMSPVRSAFGDATWLPSTLPFFREYPVKRTVSMRESLALGKIPASAKIEDLASAISALPEIAYFTPELADGQNSGLVSFPHAFNVVNAYKGHDAVYAENIGLCSFALNSKYAYGCYRVLESQFALKCYNSQHLNRCFELDSCAKCSDSYFCHNSEALSDSMFCFNSKGLRHAIGNLAMPRDKYLAVKESIVSQLAGELERNKSTSAGIFTLGAK